jgi:hypothetical protein
LTPACQGIKLTAMANVLARIVLLFTPKRRWAQFSLATLFVVVTVLCVGLALVVAPVERQRRAVAAIEALGGGVGYAKPDETVSEALPRSFLRRWLARDYFDEVRWVDFRGTQVTDTGMAQLHGLTGLDALFIGGTQVTDAGLAHVQELTRLKCLLLEGTRVTDAGLVHLQASTDLQVLYFDGTHVTDAGLVQLQQALPNCAICRLSEPRP